MSLFDFLRDQVGLDQIVSANGSGKARCVSPSHQDEDPSMQLYDDHAHCFACGFHADVTDVWAAMRGFDKPIEAALDLAREFAIKLPQANPEARQKACERRDKEDLYLQQAKACHGALSRHPRVTEWWEARGFGQGLRERFLLGTNKDGMSAIIPFWNRGCVQGLIRRKLEGEPKYLYPKVEEFSGGHRPLFIPASMRSGAFLTEGIVDALALAAIGEGAIAVGGTGMSRKQLRELDRVPGPLYILPDAGEEGGQAAREWVRKLYPKALVCPAEYEGGGRRCVRTSRTSSRTRERQPERFSGACRSGPWMPCIGSYRRHLRAPTALVPTALPRNGCCRFFSSSKTRARGTPRSTTWPPSSSCPSSRCARHWSRCSKSREDHNRSRRRLPETRRRSPEALGRSGP
jgi:hypothetical protein